MSEMRRKHASPRPKTDEPHTGALTPRAAVGTAVGGGTPASKPYEVKYSAYLPARKPYRAKCQTETRAILGDYFACVFKSLGASTHPRVGYPRTTALAENHSISIGYLVAERQGFEPWRRFPAYTLSRRAPSTTRPPLRAALSIPARYGVTRGCGKKHRCRARRGAQDRATF